MEIHVLGLVLIHQLITFVMSSVLTYSTYDRPTARIQTVPDLSNVDDGLVLKTEDSGQMQTEDGVKLKQAIHDIPVSHFARHALCRHEQGRKKFYEALKHKLCSTKETFIANFVEDLCKHKGSLLDSWVSEAFDFDGDGYLTHFERNFYDFK